MDLTNQTTTGWQKFMSFIGNIAAAQSAKAIGKYNEGLAYQQAAYERKKAAVREKVYNNIERPRFVDQQERAYSNFFVSALRTGAEFREGTTPFLVGVENRSNQMLDLALADYNQKVTFNDQINQSLLLETKAIGERFKGDLTARTEFIKGVGGAITFGNQVSGGSLLG